MGGAIIRGVAADTGSASPRGASGVEADRGVAMGCDDVDA
jgi:hypothetical protein